MIRSRRLVISFLLSVLLVDTGMCREQAVAVSAGRDGNAQITLATGEKSRFRKNLAKSASASSRRGTEPGLAC
jgi:hypothetical protein